MIFSPFSVYVEYSLHQVWKKIHLTDPAKTIWYRIYFETKCAINYKEIASNRMNMTFSM